MHYKYAGDFAVEFIVGRQSYFPVEIFFAGNDLVFTYNPPVIIVSGPCAVGESDLRIASETVAQIKRISVF